jgi:hypothetical protein
VALKHKPIIPEYYEELACLELTKKLNKSFHDFHLRKPKNSDIHCIEHLDNALMFEYMNDKWYWINFIAKQYDY